MDPQALQALMQVFQQQAAAAQQGMQLLQQLAGGAGQAGPGADPGMADADPNAESDPYAMDENEAPEGYGGDPYMAEGDAAPPSPDDDMPNPGNLHDRVSQLESHTGLKKSASGLFDRVSDLEENVLGATYRGNITDRVKQLEDTVLAKSVRQQSQRRSQRPSESAPDFIPLDSLIKTAVQQGIKEGLGQLHKSAGTAVLPDVEQHRPSIRRRQTPEAELTKSGAGGFGYTEEELDQPPGFGDVLLAQYYAQKSGDTLFPDDDD